MSDEDVIYAVPAFTDKLTEETRLKMTEVRLEEVADDAPSEVTCDHLNLGMVGVCDGATQCTHTGRLGNAQR